MDSSKKNKAFEYAKKIIDDMPEWQRRYAQEIIDTALKNDKESEHQNMLS